MCFVLLGQRLCDAATEVYIFQDKEPYEVRLYVHIFSYFFKIKMNSFADTSLTYLAVCLVLRETQISFLETRGIYLSRKLTHHIGKTVFLFYEMS